MVSVRLDRDRPLRYTWAAIKQCKQATGVNLLNLKDADFSDPVTVSAIVWAGLLADDPSVTIEQVDQWIEIPRLGAIAEAVARAMGDSMGQDPLPAPGTPTTLTGPSPKPAAVPFGLVIAPGNSSG